MNWIWKGRDDVIFETAGNAKKREKIKNIKRFVIAAAVLVVLAIVLILKQYNFNISAAIGKNDKKDEEITSSDNTNDDSPVYSVEKKTFMFFCSNDEKTALDFLILMRVDLEDDVISIHPVDVNAKSFTFRDFSGSTLASASDCFKTGGSSMLYEASENYLGKKIDKYIGTTESDFSNIIVNFPNIKVDLENELKLSKDSDSVYFNKGIQEISDVNLLKFMTYGGRSSVEDLLKDQANVAASAVTTFINETMVENAEVVFDRIINLSTSNVSVFDLKTNLNSLEYISKYGSEFEYNTLLYKDDFIKSIE